LFVLKVPEHRLMTGAASRLPVAGGAALLVEAASKKALLLFSSMTGL
jgi:hypothetical protein